MFSVVPDACVLYPAYLRDTLLRMAAVEMYQPLWTVRILDELLANRPETMGRAARQRPRDAMVESFPDADVTGHEALVSPMRPARPGGRFVRVEQGDRGELPRGQPPYGIVLPWYGMPQVDERKHDGDGSGFRVRGRAWHGALP